MRVDSDRPAGTEVTVAIRPERLGLWHADADRESQLDATTGRIDRVTFLGNSIAYDVVTERGDPPQTFRVRWAPTSATVLED
jgi:ABC-type Fe3+/spermidine/putrescine transport system ATPase subunit